MKKIFAVILTVILFSACSQMGNDNNDEVVNDEIIDVENVEIPAEIFISNKQNSEIDEQEIKESIKTYLDSHDELDDAIYAYEDAIDDEIELSKNEINKFSKMLKLIQENDDNFSRYISDNTLPEGYQKETERISQFITTYNAFHYELGEMFIDQIEAAEKGQLAKVDVISLIGKMNTVKGKEQEKIEKFLKKKGIKTKAFGMDN